MRSGGREVCDGDEDAVKIVRLVCRGSNSYLCAGEDWRWLIIGVCKWRRTGNLRFLEVSAMSRRNRVEERDRSGK